MKERVRILRFTIIGTLNALIAAFVVWLMMHIRKEDYMLANVTAYVVSQIHNFYLVQVLDFPAGQGRQEEYGMASDAVLCGGSSRWLTVRSLCSCWCWWNFCAAIVSGSVPGSFLFTGP